MGWGEDIDFPITVWKMGVPLSQICAGFQAKFCDEEGSDCVTCRPLSLEAMLKGVTQTMTEDNKMKRRSEPVVKKIRSCCSPSLWRTDRSPWDGGKGDGTRCSLVIRQPEEMESLDMIRTMLLCGHLSPVSAALVLAGMVTEPWGGGRRPSAGQGAWQKALLSPGR